MFAREVVLQLKPNVVNELPVTFEKEILPLLRRQKGFVDELLLVTPEKKEVEAISLWETKEYAEAYNRELYPQIEKIMARFIEGIPVVKKFDAEYYVPQDCLCGNGLIAELLFRREGAKFAPSFFARILAGPCGKHLFGFRVIRPLRFIGVTRSPTGEGATHPRFA